MKICVTGSKGRLGSELVNHRCLPLFCDITEADQVMAELAAHEPDVIINCAALTCVDDAEHPEKRYNFYEVNGFGVDILRTCYEGRIIHISTDYVFSGKRGPYREGAFINYHKVEPVNEYGFSKAIGESAILDDYAPGDTVVRTTGLYGNSDHVDFVKAVSRRLENDLEFHATKNLRGNQTYVPHLVDGLLHLAEMENPPKVLHIASKEVISRYEFALMIANTFGFDVELVKPTTNGAIAGWVAKRPTKGGLRVDLAEELGIPIYRIIDGLEALRGVMNI